MNYPTVVKYNEAIMAAKYRLKVADQNLKAGSAEIIQSNIGPAPLYYPGGMAIVYKFNTPNGPRALRCFIVEPKPDVAERYRAIGTYFKAHLPNYTINFIYHDQGIKVQLSDGSYDIFPLIEMDWVQGKTLIERVDELCLQNDSKGLQQLAERCMDLFGAMQHAKVAHSDLAGANIMVRPNDSLVLIDYDGVYIPDFAGRVGVTNGQPPYQHKDVQNRPFDERMDNFSMLVIYTALRCLSARPKLWQQFTQRDANGKLKNENLLFNQSCFENPLQSPIFKEVQKIAEVKNLVGELANAARGAIDAVTLPPPIFKFDRAEKEALGKFAAAITTNRDRVIRDAWDKILDGYAGVTQDQLDRLALARWRPAARNAFNKALYLNIDKDILESYDPRLEDDLDNPFPESARKRLEEARARVELPARLLAACDAGDDQAIYNLLVLVQHKIPTTLPPERQGQAALAVQRVEARNALRAGVQSDDDRQILAVDPKLFEGWDSLQPAEWERVQLARRRSEITQRLPQLAFLDDEAGLTELYRAEQQIIDAMPQLHEHLRQRVLLAVRRAEARARLDQAIAAQDDQAIADAYDELVTAADQPKANPRLLQLTPDAQQRVALAQDRRRTWMALQRALADEDEQTLLEIRVKFPELLGRLAKDARDAVELTAARVAALAEFRKVVYTSADERQVVANYSPVLNDYRQVLPQERAIYGLARQAVQMYDQVRQALQSQDYLLLTSVYNPALERPWMSFTLEERARLALAQQHKQLWQTLETAVAGGSDEQIAVAAERLLTQQPDLLNHLPAELGQRVRLARDRVAAVGALRLAIYHSQADEIVSIYDQHRAVLDGYSGLSDVERKQVAAARRYQAARQAFQAALDSDLDSVILASLAPELEPRLEPAQQARLVLARERTQAIERLRAVLPSDDDERIVAAYPTPIRQHRELAADEIDRAELAAKRVHLRNILRTALYSYTGPREIIDAFDPALLIGAPILTDAELKLVEQAQRTVAVVEKIHAALKVDNLEGALRIEQESRLPIVDRELSTAKRRYLMGREPRNVIARERQSYIEIYWDWPIGSFIDIVTVFLRHGQPPGSPGAALRDPECLVERIDRKKYGQQGHMRFSVPRPGPWYVLVASSLHDYRRGRPRNPAEQDSDWLFSPTGGSTISRPY